MKKQVTAALLALALVVGLLHGTALAAQPVGEAAINRVGWRADA